VHVDCTGIRRSIARGHLRALALCSTSYATGRSVAFYDGVDSIADWARVQRVGCRTEMTVDHLMASAAIPLLFPPMKIGEEYFGDGAMRQIHPLSPAIHLGADRLLVIGVRARRAAGVTVDRLHTVMPTPGEIFGYMLDTLFTDQIYGDLEQLERIKHAGAQRAAGRPRRTADRDADAGAECRSARDRGAPRGRDAAGTAGTAAGDRRPRRIRLPAGELSHVRGGYTRALIELGYRDAMEARSGALGVHERREAAAGDDRRRSSAGDLNPGTAVAARTR